ncbi:hypothetical protein AVEN_134282-1 [Araneus ventricosus]|uniref:Uncharacterized protein n=1 Tax=Araneus ventricosus TaxID=182803 RepID=A0A4Y2L241_ARAVE|nr:hypothetical protein AVEN_134282-1 [Araneus ventricosus]
MGRSEQIVIPTNQTFTPGQANQKPPNASISPEKTARISDKILKNIDSHSLVKAQRHRESEENTTSSTKSHPKTKIILEGNKLNEESKNNVNNKSANGKRIAYNDGFEKPSKHVVIGDPKPAVNDNPPIEEILPIGDSEVLLGGNLNRQEQVAADNSDSPEQLPIPVECGDTFTSQ